MEKMHKTILDFLFKNSTHDNLRVIIINKDDYQKSKDYHDGYRAIGISNVGVIHDYFGYQYGVVEWKYLKDHYLLSILVDDFGDNDSVIECIDCGELEKINKQTIKTNNI
jgi:hypothetical protein